MHPVVEIDNKLATISPQPFMWKTSWNKNHWRIHTNAVNSILPKIQFGMFSGKIGGVTLVSLKSQSFLDRTYTCTFSTTNTHKYTQDHKTRIYMWFGQYCLHPQSTPDIFIISQEWTKCESADSTHTMYLSHSQKNYTQCFCSLLEKYYIGTFCALSLKKLSFFLKSSSLAF